MVMSGSHSLEVGTNLDKNNDLSFIYPHNSIAWLKINRFQNIHILHQFCMILSLNHWRNYTCKSQLQSISFSLFVCFPRLQVRKISLTHLFVSMWANTLMHPHNVFHAISCHIFQCASLIFECYGMHHSVFLFWWYIWISFLIWIPSPI